MDNAFLVMKQEQEQESRTLGVRISMTMTMSGDDICICINMYFFSEQHSECQIFLLLTKQNNAFHF